MGEFRGQLRIRKVRSRGKIGGIIFSAITLDQKPVRYVVKANWKIARLPSLFREGHLWEVIGKTETQIIKWKDGSEQIENVLIPSEMKFIKASNENLKRLLVESKEFKGISEVKAEKLVSFFGDELYDIAAQNNIGRLTPILGKNVASRLIDGLSVYQEINTLRLLDELGVPPYIGESVLKIWGVDAYKKVKENPYLLGVFMADLNIVDEYAIHRLGFDLDSTHRLIAYVKDVMFSAFKSGNTCLPTAEAKYRVKRLLGDLGEQAFDLAAKSGEIVVDGAITQVRSMDIVESSIASIIARLREFQYPESLEKRVDAQIQQFEISAGFPLTEEQKNAISSCCTSRLTLLTGGAGCGKTTVIEAICYTLEKLYQTKEIYLMALAGKAAERITEATGRDAMTIASFVFNIDAEDISDDATFIVDEASMVDVLSLLKILKKLPPKGRLILTGDEEQLPPVGIGLSLHALVGADIRKSVLTAVKRQSEESGIPKIANQIRNYHIQKNDIIFKAFTGISEGVSFVECAELDINLKTISIYEELDGNGSNNDVLILSPTKYMVGGIVELNAAIHDKYAKGDVIVFNDSASGQVNHHINGRSVREGELVMYTLNDYEKGIRNGSIGKVIGKINNGISVDFDGNIVSLSLHEMTYLEHAYCLTVHKSQGSQFERVIVVVRNNRNLDRHLVYTALTRAKKQVVFVGDKSAFNRALETSNAHKRHTKLAEHLGDLI